MHDFDEEEFNWLISNDEKIEQMRDKLFNEEIYKQFIPNSENFDQLQKRIADLDADGDITDEKREELQKAISDYMTELDRNITPEHLMAFSNAMQEFYEPEDISEILAQYDPKPDNDTDREFVNELKEWITSQFNKITDDDVYVMGILYGVGFNKNDEAIVDLSFSYDTESHYKENLVLFDGRWNLADFKENYFDTFDTEKLEKWFSAKGLSFEDANDDIMDKILDLAVIAVSELHSENAISERFGRKIPMIMNDLEYYRMTAVRAVKANGAELFDEEFFDCCGCESPE